MICIGKHYINSKKLYTFWFSFLSPPSLPQKPHDTGGDGNKDREKNWSTELSNLCPGRLVMLLIRKKKKVIWRRSSLIMKIISFHYGNIDLETWVRFQTEMSRKLSKSGNVAQRRVKGKFTD